MSNALNKEIDVAVKHPKQKEMRILFTWLDVNLGEENKTNGKINTERIFSILNNPFSTSVEYIKLKKGIKKIEVNNKAYLLVSIIFSFFRKFPLLSQIASKIIVNTELKFLENGKQKAKII